MFRFRQINVTTRTTHGSPTLEPRDSGRRQDDARSGGRGRAGHSRGSARAGEAQHSVPHGSDVTITQDSDHTVFHTWSDYKFGDFSDW